MREDLKIWREGQTEIPVEGRVGAKVQRKKYTDCLEKSKESSFRLWGEHEKRQQGRQAQEDRTGQDPEGC